MKITIKTLQNKKFDLEVFGTEKIDDIKTRIDSELGLGAPELQKLIYHGKILKDDQTVESAKFKEKDFVVVMIAKAKKKKKPVAPSVSSQPQQEQLSSPPASSTQVTEPAASSPADTSNSSAVTSDNASSNAMEISDDTNTASAAATSSDSASVNVAAQSSSSASDQPAQAIHPAGFQASASALVMGADFEQMVANLMNLGFEHDAVVRALRASFNNPDRAAEYLFTGIPENVAQAQAAQAQQQQAQQQEQDADASMTQPSQGTGANVSGSAVAQVNTGTVAAQESSSAPASQGNQDAAAAMLGGITPEQASQVLQNNPEMLQAIVQQISQQQPQLMEQLGGNPEALMQLLQNPQILQDLFQAMNQQGGGGVSGIPGMPGVQGGASGGVPPQGVIQVTEEEKQAIDRLQLLGFERRRAIEAYIACDKNEEIAANYLFDHINDNDVDFEVDTENNGSGSGGGNGSDGSS